MVWRVRYIIGLCEYTEHMDDCAKVLVRVHELKGKYVLAEKLVNNKWVLAWSR